MLPKRVEFGTSCLLGASVKRGETLSLPQPIRMVANPRDELVLPHPGVERLRSLHKAHLLRAKWLRLGAVVVVNEQACDYVRHDLPLLGFELSATTRLAQRRTAGIVRLDAPLVQKGIG